MTPDPRDELVDVLDDVGRVIGTATRREVRARGLSHRCTYVLVFNRRGELFIHLRTPTKDVYPSHWDVAVGGVVAAGETLDRGAKREVQEELGVALEVMSLFLMRQTIGPVVEHAMVYRAIHDGPFRLQPAEIVRGEFAPLTEVIARTERERFCPDGLAVLAEYRRRMEHGG
jgi:isopentenyldiphosphate isomerase